MRCIIAGGRDYRLTLQDMAFLDTLGIREVICGGAAGADEGGATWARFRGLPVTYFQADWKAYGRAAGPLRNKLMAKNADAVVLFPGGRGTDSMRKMATVAGLRIINPPQQEA